MRGRAEVRRAQRRAVSKLGTEPRGGDPLDVYIEEPEPVSAGQRVLRRALAILMAVFIPLIGAALLVMGAFDGGTGYQVGPILALMVGVMFGIPTISILIRHARAEWQATARQ